MSLQVWLPMTKDLRQQGLSDVEVTNNGAVFNSVGKLGGCYQFETAASGIGIPKDSMTSFSEASVSFWVKILSWNTSYCTLFQAGTSSRSWPDYIFGVLRNGSNSTLCFTIGNTSSTTTTACQTSALNLNEWYHMVFTYKNKKMCIYLNGELHKEYTSSMNADFSKITKISLGRANDEQYQSNCLMNDVRIYDHCLSPMEVKRLSQGLILHYPLNRQGFGQENLLLNSTVPIAGPGATGITKSITEDGLQKVVAESDNSNWCTFNNHNTTLDLIKGDTFTFSLMIKSDDSVKKPTVYFQNGLGYYNMQGTMSSNWSIIYYTGVWSIDNLTTAIHLGFSSAPGTYYIKYFKLEKGDKVTPWAPNHTDEIYTIMDLSGITEYDTSGYCNNGTRVGTFDWTSDTPRYSVSQYFNGSSYILTDSGTFSWFDFDKCTIAVWMKPTTTPSSWAGTFGIAHNNSSSNKSFVIGNYGGKFTVQSANGGWVNIQSSDLPINEWHYCVATLDGTDIKMYFDGELIKTYTTSWGSTTVASDTRVQVGNDLPGSDEIYQGYYSDARIYATALSADDVRALYENSAYIDNSNNVYAATYTEV